MSRRQVVARVDEIPPGERKILPIGGQGGIGVFNIEGEFYALRNRCPHKGGPLCQGRLRPHITANGVYQVEPAAQQQILKCAWNQWEFDLTTGAALYDPRLRVKTYKTAIKNEMIVVYLD